MTKMKSKKMTKSTFAIIIMGIVMVAMLAFGGTFAYFTATTTAKTGTFKTGTVNLAAGDYTISSSTLVPGDDIVATAIKYTNSSDVKTYVFVKYTVAPKENTTLPEGITVDKLVTATKLGDGWEDYTTTQAGVYYKIVESTETELTFAEGIKLNPDLASNSHDGTKGTAMGIELTITIQARSIQFANTTDVATAYAAAFAAAEKVA